MAKKLTIDLPDTFEVAIPKTRDKTFQVSTAKWSVAHANRLFNFGMKEYANNACSGKPEDECVKLCRDRVAKVLSAELDWGSGGGVELSPFERAMRQVAIKSLCDHCGRKKVDATKDAAKSIEDAAKSVVLTLDAKSNGKEKSDLTGDHLAAAVKTRIDLWQVAARKIVEIEAALEV